MTRWLLISLCVCLATFPLCAFGGNAKPQLSLEVYRFEKSPEQVPSRVCCHTDSLAPQIPCFEVRKANDLYYVPLHVGNLDTPICPAIDSDCTSYGGYVGCGFGVSQSALASRLYFVSWNVCPGFVKGPSKAGEPAACLAASNSGCHNWYDHAGYLIFANQGADSSQVLLEITPNADFGHYKVINCAFQYDDSTVVLGGVQIGGQRGIVCPGSAAKPVKEPKPKIIRTPTKKK